MDGDNVMDNALEANGAKKPPRKPRPSEIAAKLAKAAAAKKKPSAGKRLIKAAKQARKLAKKKKPAKKVARGTIINSIRRRVLKAAKRLAPKKGKKKARPTRPIIRTERLELRITKREKAKLSAKCKREERSITSIISELINKLK